MTATRLGRTIPALPALDVAASVEFYGERLGFEALHHDGGFAVLRRDDAVIHLWQADDESWKGRAAGEELRERDVLHPVSREGVSDTDFGTREFSVLDSDGNLIGFYTWVER